MLKIRTLELKLNGALDFELLKRAEIALLAWVFENFLRFLLKT